MNWDMSRNLIIFHFLRSRAKVRALRILWAVPPRTTTRSIGSNSFGCTETGFLHAGGPVTARGPGGFRQLTVGLKGALETQTKHNWPNPKHIKNKTSKTIQKPQKKMKKTIPKQKPTKKFFVVFLEKKANQPLQPTHLCGLVGHFAMELPSRAPKSSGKGANSWPKVTNDPTRPTTCTMKSWWMTNFQKYMCNCVYVYNIFQALGEAVTEKKLLTGRPSFSKIVNFQTKGTGTSTSSSSSSVMSWHFQQQSMDGSRVIFKTPVVSKTIEICSMKKH